MNEEYDDYAVFFAALGTFFLCGILIWLYESLTS